MLRRLGYHLYPPRAMEFHRMERLQREMNKLFSEFPSSYRVNRATGYPAMNVWTSTDGAVVTAELPGVASDDIDISVVNDTLTISGKRDRAECDETTRYHRRERGCGSFSRAFQLPFPVEADKVEASFEKGILGISLPRAEADKPRRIQVKGLDE